MDAPNFCRSLTESVFPRIECSLERTKFLCRLCGQRHLHALGGQCVCLFVCIYVCMSSIDMYNNDVGKKQVLN
jgi:hypothetical protein